MALVRTTSEQARKRKLTPAEKKRLDALTDKQINKAARSDPDNPPSTKAELEQMATIVRSRGRPALPDGERKIRITMRLDPDLLAEARSIGPGWQTHINDLLRRLLLDHEARPKKTVEKTVVRKAAKSRA